MLKTFVAAVVSALTAWIFTQYRADQNTIALHRSYDRKLDARFMDAYDAGWKNGEQHGYRKGHLDGKNGTWNFPE